MRIKVKKLHKDAKLPTYGHPGDAGMDLYAAEEVVVPAGAIVKIPTGIAMEIPEGCVGLCWDKSGVSMNGGVKTLAGVIDAGFRGEIVLGVYNLKDKEYIFEKGQKVAQMLVQPVVAGKIEEVSELDATSRGDGGWGSTGTH
jgi:dUTP pyrophosphatase